MLEESHNKEQIQANFIVAFLQRQFEDRYGAKLHPKNKGFMTDTLKILRVRNAGYFDQTVRQDSRPLPPPHFWMIWNEKKCFGTK